MELGPVGKLLGGAGGHWPRQDEQFDPSVVCQRDVLHCGPACAEMLLRDRGVVDIDQTAIAAFCGVPVALVELASALNQLVEPAAGSWQGGAIRLPGASDMQLLRALGTTGSWAALLWQSGQRIGHLVVIDFALNPERLLVRDPWSPGTTYTMTSQNFLDYWSQEALFWR